MDVTRPERDDQIARLQNRVHRRAQTAKRRLVVDVRVAVAAHGIAYPLTSHACHGRLARRVNFGDENLVRIMERAGEFAEQGARPGIAVRLEERQYPLPAAVARSRERGLDLGGMMRVIIHHHVVGRMIF